MHLERYEWTRLDCVDSGDRKTNFVVDDDDEVYYFNIKINYMVIYQHIIPHNLLVTPQGVRIVRPQA